METQDAVLSIDIAASRKILRQLRETEAADEFSNDFYFDDSDDYEDEDLFQVADSNSKQPQIESHTESYLPDGTLKPRSSRNKLSDIEHKKNYQLYFKKMFQIGLSTLRRQLVRRLRRGGKC